MRPQDIPLLRQLARERIAARRGGRPIVECPVCHRRLRGDEHGTPYRHERHGSRERWCPGGSQRHCPVG